MTRQQQITLEQVRCKYSEAVRRTLDELAKASDAKNHEDFVDHMALSTKAAKDAETWHHVLTTLEEAQ